jgi:uncharacterized protein YbjT (DUF2867 family)
MRVLVTGATGYIGGRLIPQLLAHGFRVRVLVRDASRIEGRPWLQDVEVAVGDILDRDSLAAALDGVDHAYYLVHSMMSEGFQELDRRAAETFVSASPASLRKVTYLGGLVPTGEQRSAHLRSRSEVGAILRASLPAFELRAGPIIGSGSASFEMLRYLTERLPAMIAPRWIDNLVQPVAIDDVLQYLVRAASSPVTGVVEIGADRLSFRQMMQTYAEVRGLHRRILAVPVLAPRVAGLWVGLVTPIPNRLAVPLIEGIVEPVVADTSRARALFPAIQPIRYRDAVVAALRTDMEIETRWSGALHRGDVYELTDREGLIREVRSIRVNASPSRVFAAFTSLGGDRGWRVWNLAWKVRGALDRLVGGPGLRRGRRDPQRLLAGESLDFWRVESIEKDRRLRLRAEMRVPGEAWLQWEVIDEDGGSRLIQTATFAPRGLLGPLYWYALYPLHARIFSDLAHAIAREAEIETGRAIQKNVTPIADRREAHPRDASFFRSGRSQQRVIHRHM